MQHVFILLVAVPAASWQKDRSKINVKTKLFVNMYCIYSASSLYHTSNSLLFSSFASILNNPGLKFWFPDNSGIVKKKKRKEKIHGEVYVSIQKTRRGSTFFHPHKWLIRRFVTTHIVKTAHNGFCMLFPELSIYIISSVSSFSSSS